MTHAVPDMTGAQIVTFYFQADESVLIDRAPVVAWLIDVGSDPKAEGVEEWAAAIPVAAETKGTYWCVRQMVHGEEPRWWFLEDRVCDSEEEAAQYARGQWTRDTQRKS